MKKIVIIKQMSWVDTCIWIEQNKKTLVECKDDLVIDFSDLYHVYSNMIGLTAHVNSERTKKGLETEIIQPDSKLMKIIFNGIFGT